MRNTLTICNVLKTQIIRNMLFTLIWTSYWLFFVSKHLIYICCFVFYIFWVFYTNKLFFNFLLEWAGMVSLFERIWQMIGSIKKRSHHNLAPIMQTISRALVELNPYRVMCCLRTPLLNRVSQGKRQYSYICVKLSSHKLNLSRNRVIAIIG